MGVLSLRLSACFTFIIIVCQLLIFFGSEISPFFSWLHKSVIIPIVFLQLTIGVNNWTMDFQQNSLFQLMQPFIAKLSSTYGDVLDKLKNKNARVYFQDITDLVCDYEKLLLQEHNMKFVNVKMCSGFRIMHVSSQVHILFTICHVISLFACLYFFYRLNQKIFTKKKFDAQDYEYSVKFAFVSLMLSFTSFLIINIGIYHLVLSLSSTEQTMLSYLWASSSLMSVRGNWVVKILEIVIEILMVIIITKSNKKERQWYEEKDERRKYRKEQEDLQNALEAGVLGFHPGKDNWDLSTKAITQQSPGAHSNNQYSYGAIPNGNDYIKNMLLNGEGFSKDNDILMRRESPYNFYSDTETDKESEVELNDPAKKEQFRSPKPFLPVVTNMFSTPVTSVNQLPNDRKQYLKDKATSYPMAGDDSGEASEEDRIEAAHMRMKKERDAREKEERMKARGWVPRPPSKRVVLYDPNYDNDGLNPQLDPVEYGKAHPNFIKNSQPRVRISEEVNQYFNYKNDLGSP